MKTLILSKKIISQLLPIPELMANLKKAYIDYFQEKTIKPQRICHEINDTSIVINSPGYLANSKVFTTKVNVKVPQNIEINLPFIQGTILLMDHTNGALLAIMESSLITAIRTGAAGALGVDYLANPEDTKIGLIGAGVQAEWQVKALHALERVSRVTIFDISSAQAIRFAQKISEELQIPTEIETSIQNTINKSEILIATTPSKKPLIENNMLHPGMHINAFGADQKNKVELAAECINTNCMVVDDYNLSINQGSLNVAYQNDQLNADKKIFEIGELLSKNICPRNSKEQITIFGNIGVIVRSGV